MPLSTYEGLVESFFNFTQYPLNVMCLNFTETCKLAFYIVIPQILATFFDKKNLEFGISILAKFCLKKRGLTVAPNALS